MADPIVKWPGGKTRLLQELLSRLPASWHRYYEPFAGGAALFFRLAPSRAVLGDSNRELIATYQTVARDVSSIGRHLTRYRAAHSPSHYYATRMRWNTQRARWDRARTAATFIYLNKTCFNGLWRVNRAGEFNVPVGRYTNPTIFSPASLAAARDVLACADLRAGDYRRTVVDAARGDLIYLDPPYHPVSATASFTSYTANDFGVDDQRALAATARELVARGCHVMLSNSDTPFIRDLYRGFRIHAVTCSRSINSVGDKRGLVDELIIVG